MAIHATTAIERIRGMQTPRAMTIIRKYFLLIAPFEFLQFFFTHLQDFFFCFHAVND
jgi:hypothetical protein